MDLRDILAKIDSIFNHNKSSYGIDYLSEVGEKISQEMDVAYVLFGRPDDTDYPTSIITDVCVANGKVQDNIQYDLVGTPCHNVVKGLRVCLHEKDAAKLFPKDTLLEQMGVESYVGSAMIDSQGQLIGLCVLLDTKPIEDIELMSLFTEFVSGRAAVEYERQLSEEKLLSMNEQLAERVQEKTRELEEEKKQLESSNSELRKVTEQLQETQKKVADAARISGMAEMSSLTLHTIGNSVNTISVEHELSKEIQSLLDKISDSLGKLSENLPNLISSHRSDRVKEFVDSIKESLEEVSTKSNAQRLRISNALLLVRKSLKYQGRYTHGAEAIYSKFILNDLITECLDALGDQIRSNNIEVIKDIVEGVAMYGEKHKIFHTLITILNNAIDSIIENEAKKNTIAIKVAYLDGDDRVSIEICDTGIGIKTENENKLFGFGFSTKDQGTGVGLHDSATYLKKIGGTIEIENLGVNIGAKVSITLPAKISQSTVKPILKAVS